MAPILLKIPITIPFCGHIDLPIYGFGMMLVLAFIFAPGSPGRGRAARDSMAT